MKSVTGKTLITLGYKPSKWFKEAIDHLNSLELVNQKIIKEYCDQLVKENTIDQIELFENPIPYEIFLEANTKEEITNYQSVKVAMDAIMKTPTVVAGAIMPDACPVGFDHIPVGGVAVTKNAIHPKMHSSDVCCSVMLTTLGNNIELKSILDTAMKVTHFGQGRIKGYKDNRGYLEGTILEKQILQNYFTKDYIEKAYSHLGTQGDGNHFLFVGTSKNTGKPTIVTHHGSRGFGASVYKKAFNEAEKYTKKICPSTKNPWLDYTTDIGKEYWEALQLIKQWTELNHQFIHQNIANKLGVPIEDNYWNEHNFVFKQDELFYHAKGSTPMDSIFEVGYGSCALRLIPLNMSQPVLVVKENKENIFGFAPHGAGRNLSRSTFQKNTNLKNLQKEIQGLDIRFYSGKADISEFPSAYKDADEVKRQIEKFNLCTVVDEILPYGCIMAGEQEKYIKKIK